MQRFFEKRLHNSNFWLTFATETKNKQVMKIYIERIMNCNGKEIELVGIGSIFSNKRAAVNFLRKVKSEMGGFVTSYSEEDLSISYKTFRGLMHLEFEERLVASECR